MKSLFQRGETLTEGHFQRAFILLLVIHAYENSNTVSGNNAWADYICIRPVSNVRQLVGRMVGAGDGVVGISMDDIWLYTIRSVYRVYNSGGLLVVQTALQGASASPLTYQLFYLKPRVFSPPAFGRPSKLLVFLSQAL